MTKEELKKRIEDILETFQTAYPGCMDSMFHLRYGDCNPDERWIELKYTVEENAYNILGILHGGAAAWLLDNGVGVCLGSFIGGESPAINTVNLNINYLKSAKAGSELTIHVQIESIGYKICTLSSKIYEGTQLCYSALSTYYRHNAAK